MSRKLFSALLIVLLLASCTGRGSYVAIRGYAQGGVYGVKCRIDRGTRVPGRNAGQKSLALKDGIDSILQVVDRAVSGYNPESLLSRRNAGADIFSVSDTSAPEFAVLNYLDRYGDSLYAATGGVLDTRSGALFDVWGFGFKNGEMPSDSLVSAAMTDRSRSNFNAVAQGYSADLVGEYLERCGIEDFLIDIGGEMLCRGVNPNGRNWTVAIDTPDDDNAKPGEHTSACFAVKGRRAVVTSGNYRKFYVRDGVKYSHTIDPRSGRPVTHNLLSATIVAPTSVLADALATYCMVIGTDAARDFILSRADIEGCLISSDSLWMSPGMETIFNFMP